MPRLCLGESAVVNESRIGFPIPSAPLMLYVMMIWLAKRRASEWSIGRRRGDWKGMQGFVGPRQKREGLSSCRDGEIHLQLAQALDS